MLVITCVGCSGRYSDRSYAVDADNPFTKGSKEWMAYEDKVCGGSDYIGKERQGACPEYHRLHNGELNAEKSRYETSPEGQAAKAKQIEEARAALDFVYKFQQWEQQMYQSMTPEQRDEVQRQRYQSDVDDYNWNQRTRCRATCAIQGGRYYSTCISSCNLIW